MVNRRRVEITMAILYETMQICLMENTDFNTEERLYARVAYINLNALNPNAAQLSCDNLVNRT